MKQTTPPPKAANFFFSTLSDSNPCGKFGPLYLLKKKRLHTTVTRSSTTCYQIETQEVKNERFLISTRQNNVRFFRHTLPSTKRHTDIKHEMGKTLSSMSLVKTRFKTCMCAIKLGFQKVNVTHLGNFVCASPVTHIDGN